MATRRGAANLDDLKARLGYTEGADSGASAATGTEAPTAEPDAEAHLDSGRAASPAAAPAPRPVIPAATEDYSSAVAAPESTTVEFDAHAVDPTLKAPVSGALTGTIIAAAVALVIGLVAGVAGVTSNSARQLENATTDDATRVIDTVRPVSAMLTALDADLASIDAEAGFRPAFQEKLSAAYSGEARSLDASQVANANTLMIREGRLGSDLVNFAVSTSFLASLVDRHLQATQRDAEEIARLEQGLADTSNYGIAIQFETLLARFQAFVADPAASPFSPIAAERVTYANLEMAVEGEGDDRREFYNVVNAAGQPMRVLIHDLVLLPRDQLMPPVSSENALDRYRVRAAQIKELLTRVTTEQGELLTQLEALATRPKYFTF